MQSFFNAGINKHIFYLCKFTRACEKTLQGGVNLSTAHPDSRHSLIRLGRCILLREVVVEKTSEIAMMQNMMQNYQAEETEQNPWVSKSGGDFLECTLFLSTFANTVRAMYFTRSGRYERVDFMNFFIKFI